MLSQSERAVGSRLLFSGDRQRRLRTLLVKSRKEQSDILRVHTQLDRSLGPQIVRLEDDIRGKTRKHILVLGQLCIYCELFIEYPNIDQSVLTPMIDLVNAFYEYREYQNTDYRTNVPGNGNMLEEQLTDHRAKVIAIDGDTAEGRPHSYLMKRLLFVHRWLLVLQLHLGTMSHTRLVVPYNDTNKRSDGRVFLVSKPIASNQTLMIQSTALGGTQCCEILADAITKSNTLISSIDY